MGWYWGGGKAGGHTGRVLEMSENPGDIGSYVFSVQGCAVPSGPWERMRGGSRSRAGDVNELQNQQPALQVASFCRGWFREGETTLEDSRQCLFKTTRI